MRCAWQAFPCKARRYRGRGLTLHHVNEARERGGALYVVAAMLLQCDHPDAILAWLQAVRDSREVAAVEREHLLALDHADAHSEAEDRVAWAALLATDPLCPEALRRALLTSKRDAATDLRKCAHLVAALEGGAR